MSISPKLQVSIIGAGKVATHLAHGLKKHNVRIGEIYSRKLDDARVLCKHIPKASAVDSLDFSSSSSALFLVAVKDSAIEEIAGKIQLPSVSHIAHTSGTTSIDLLAASGDKYGIFYPLQTFADDHVVDFSEIPLLIDGNNQETKDMLMQLGNTLSSRVSLATDSERQRLHVAAVFASNFTNRMLAAAEEILKGTNLDLEVLKPLMIQTIDNVFKQGPDQALTGPAVRNDTSTINKHLDLLHSYPQLQEIYKNLTEKIINKLI